MLEVTISNSVAGKVGMRAADGTTHSPSSLSSSNLFHSLEVLRSSLQLLGHHVRQ
jgi:hypothetical protein